MLLRDRNIGWVAIKQNPTNPPALEVLGFILLLGALNRRETRRARIRNPTYD